MDNIITTVYLIRHSRKIDNSLLDNTNNNEYYQNRREKIILSIDGEKRAERLSKLKEFDDIDVIFSSNYARAIQTAKYLAESKKLVIHIDERFNERKLGIQKEDEMIYIKQYYDENIKNLEGESRKEVTDRMLEGFLDAININRGKKITIFTHGAAMTFLLMKWCKLEYIKENKHKCLNFNNQIVIDRVFDAPEIFKLLIDSNNNVLSVENIVLEEAENK